MYSDHKGSLHFKICRSKYEAFFVGFFVFWVVFFCSVYRLIGEGFIECSSQIDCESNITVGVTVIEH